MADKNNNLSQDSVVFYDVLLQSKLNEAEGKQILNMIEGYMSKKIMLEYYDYIKTANEMTDAKAVNLLLEIQKILTNEYYGTDANPTDIIKKITDVFVKNKIYAGVDNCLTIETAD